MARCEDYPCCGHAGDPGGCPDFENKRTCKTPGCGMQFYPDNYCYDFCSRCNADHQIRHGYMDEETGQWIEGTEDDYFDEDGERGELDDE